MKTLFDIPIKKPEPRKEKCKTCEYAERWECGGSFFWYCRAIKSKRTNNGLLKIKAGQTACDKYKNKLTK